MSNWTQGYVNEVAYIYGYHAQTNPLAMVLPLLMKGYAVPKIRNACELGFGQGVSLNVHATIGMGMVRWYGTDFLPEHAEFTQNMADAVGHDALICEQSFAEFCARDDLPQFEYIVLHGIWSWITEENCQIIVDFIRRKLAIGGVLYISYNMLPAWSGKSPLRQLMKLYYDNVGRRDCALPQKVIDCLNFTEQTAQASPALQSMFPALLPAVDNFKKSQLNYVAHEFLNMQWRPMYFSEIHDYLSQAKLTYVGEHNLLRNNESWAFTEEQQAMLQAVEHQLPLYETLKDYLDMTQFRCDFWVKGGRKLNHGELTQQRDSVHVLLFEDPEKIKGDIVSNGREIHLDSDLLNSLVSVLRDHQVHSLLDIHRSLQDKFPKQVIFDAIVLLVGSNSLMLANDEATTKNIEQHCRAFNEWVAQLACHSHQEQVTYLLSPVTGRVFSFNRITLMLVRAHQLGLVKLKEKVQFVWQCLNELGQVLTKDGKNLETVDENLHFLKEEAKNFDAYVLPNLKILRILD